MCILLHEMELVRNMGQKKLGQTQNMTWWSN